jgi:hypothetical protein
MRMIGGDKLKERSEEVGWAVKGGVEIPHASGDAIIIAKTAVIVGLNDGAGWVFR